MERWYYSNYEDDDQVVSMTEDEIIETYYPHWYSMMCKKLGKEWVDESFTKRDCIDDWVIVNWAWQENK